MTERKQRMEALERWIRRRGQGGVGSFVAEAGLGRATVARFRSGKDVSGTTLEKIYGAMEKLGIGGAPSTPGQPGAVSRDDYADGLLRLCLSRLPQIALDRGEPIETRLQRLDAEFNFIRNEIFTRIREYPGAEQ